MSDLWALVRTIWDDTKSTLDRETFWDDFPHTEWDGGLSYHDHSEIAWNNFLVQHDNKKNTEDFVRSFYPSLDVLDKALSDLYRLRHLFTSVGAQLDGVGNIVGVSRIIPGYVYLPFFGFITQPSGRPFGIARIRHKGEPYASSYTLGDYDYRRLIITKIVANNSHGTAEDLIKTFEYTLSVDGVSIQDTGNATADVLIPEEILPGDPRLQLLNYLVTNAAGVKLTPVFYTPV